MDFPRRFNATADLIAYAFGLNDIGTLAQDLQSGHLYTVRAAGSGMNVLDVVTDTGVKAVALTDGATIAVDASLGSRFTVTLGGNRTLSNPTNLRDGQRLTFVITQDGTGSRTLAYGTKYLKVGGAITLTTTAAAVDVLEFLYDLAADKLYTVNVQKAQA